MLLFRFNVIQFEYLLNSHKSMLSLDRLFYGRNALMVIIEHQAFIINLQKYWHVMVADANANIDIWLGVAAISDTDIES